MNSVSAGGISEMTRWVAEVRALFNWLPVITVTDTDNPNPNTAVTSVLADGTIRIALGASMIPGRAVGWHEMCHAIQRTVQLRIDNMLALVREAFAVRGWPAFADGDLPLAFEQMASMLPEAFLGQWGGYNHPLYGMDPAIRDPQVTAWFNSPASQTVRDWFLGLSTWMPANPTTPTLVGRGCDIASYQGTVNFDLLRTAVSFVISKATEGTGYKDPTFDRNWAEAKRVGLVRGAYHFARPDLGLNAQDEAAYFLSHIGPVNPSDLLALDYEVNWGGNVVGWCEAWLNLVHQMTGIKPYIYINLSTVRNYNWASIIAAGYPLWLALYDNQPETVPSTPWPSVAIKQWTSGGKLAGVPAQRVDLNTAFGGEAPVTDQEFVEKYNRLIKPGVDGTDEAIKKVQEKIVLANRAAGDILAKTNL